jgi:hypothetical protein
MFRKLVANLPFSPSLISQVGFYAERLRQERSVRRLSFVFIALTMIVQIIAVAVPPERSLASSSNHIINGLRTKNDILSAWDQSGSDIPAIFGIFSITRSDIQALPTNPNSSVKSNDADYWSIGRNSLNNYSGIDAKYKNSQISLQYDGTQTATTSDDRYVYQKQLRAWDIKNPYNIYQAFKGKIAATGQEFWILVDCGNLTMIGKYTPPPTIEIPEPKPPTPAIEIRKTIVDKPTTLNPGDVFAYQLEYRNTVKNSLAENVVIEDQLDTKYFDVISPNNLPITNGFLHYPVGNLSYSDNYKVITITVRLKDQITSGTKVCNVARITASNASTMNGEEVCVGVITPCPFDKNIADVNNPNCVEPQLVCSVVDASINRTTRKVTYKTITTSTNPANTSIIKYEYDYGDETIEQFNSTELEHQTSHTYSPGDYNTQVTVYFRTVGQSEGNDKKITCSTPISFDEDQPLGQTKKVKNLTQDIEDDLAISSVVQGDDILEYSLSTINSQNYDRVDIVIYDYIGDILDYATIDLDYLQQQNGVFDEKTNKIFWNDVVIPSNSSINHSFRVKIKSPIPSTNTPSTVSTGFDCKISNEYGNEITMNINCPLVKKLETLPNTGPGSSIIMMTGITSIIGYFFARSRLLAKEIDFIRKDFIATGGV